MVKETCWNVFSVNPLSRVGSVPGSRPVGMSNDPYWNRKRDLLEWQKRPLGMLKETYWNGKRDLLEWQKRPTGMVKETYWNVFA